MRAPGLLCGGLLLLGAPAGLAAIGVATLWAKRWTPERRSLVIGLALVALGAFNALINAAAIFFPVWDSGIGTRRLEYGAGVMFLGYLLTLVGVVLLPLVTPLASAEERGRG